MANQIEKIDGISLTNIEKLDEDANGMNILTSRMDEKINTAMSNSFGFGGTNASLVFRRYE